MNFIPEYTHNRKNQGSILIKKCGKQGEVFRQFDGLQLGEVADFEALTFNLALNFRLPQNCQAETKPPLSQTPC